MFSIVGKNLKLTNLCRLLFLLILTMYVGCNEMCPQIYEQWALFSTGFTAIFINYTVILRVNKNPTVVLIMMAKREKIFQTKQRS